MICHERKLIGIHIPRTGMTSMEKALFGCDYWKIDAEAKHLRASHARKRYADYWDEYFKFGFVRNPYDRMVSMLKFKDRLMPDGTFYDFVAHISSLQKSYHSYWLDEELDFVGRFEHLLDGWDEIKSRLNLDLDLPHTGKSKRNLDYRTYYDDETKALVDAVHQRDLEIYGYEF